MTTETVELRGHLIDSLLLPRVLDEVLARGGEWEVLQFELGRRRADSSRLLLRITAPQPALLQEILDAVALHGAVPVERAEACLEPAPADGVFPEGFYITTNQPTRVRIRGELLPAMPERMDGGIRVAGGEARVVRFNEVRRGDLIVTGHEGVLVQPVERDVRRRDDFEFMGSDVSPERPRGAAIRAVAGAMRQARREGKKILLVAGPAVIHTGAGPHLVRLIELGFVQILFSGNALAVHDMESQFYGTSLGLDLTAGHPAPSGHQHHLRTINRIRRLGGIRAAVDAGELKGGVMHACVRCRVEWLLAGSIRDDGPLPEVVTDAVEAQVRMAHLAEGAGFCLMTASMLHAIAASNLLPARCRIACVDINPSVVAKLADRGAFQAAGIVSDIAPFFQQLAAELEAEPA